MMKKDFNYYKELIKKNEIPEGFDQWLLMKGEFDRTLAHYAASIGLLPSNWTENSEDWLIKDAIGETIAHYASLTGILPLDWTDNQDHWLKLNNFNETIGLLFSTKSKEHYNKPKNLEDYCENIVNNLFPLLVSDTEEYSLPRLENFIDPFLNSIENATQDEFTKTSEEYSGFLIDHVESILEHIDCYIYSGSKIRRSLKESLNYILEEKIKVKEILFNKHESIVENKSCFSWEL